MRQRFARRPHSPCAIPGFDGDKVYAIIKAADASGYTVVLAATPDCAGQHVCSYGMLIGTVHSLDDDDEYGLKDRRRRTVRLHRGIKAYFYETVCSAYCNDSVIAWTEGRYLYLIGLKAESKENLIRAANSAIDAK